MRSSTTTTLERAFSSIIYILPILDALSFGGLVLGFLPFLWAIIYPFMAIFAAIPFGSFGLFLILYFAVIQNPGVNSFVRYNTLQSILIGIAVTLVKLVLELFTPILKIGPKIATEILNSGQVGFSFEFFIAIFGSFIFLAVLGVCIYCAVCSALGKYAEIPYISSNVYPYIGR
jgi:hypothetical protein